MDKIKIHIVDDDVALTTILKKCLERSGNYEVRTENQSTNAIAAIRDFKPDLILLDMIMPEIDGNEIAENIQNDTGLRHIKIVFLTAVLNKQEIGIKANIEVENMVIGKPVKFDKLIECIEEQLN